MSTLLHSCVTIAAAVAVVKTFKVYGEYSYEKRKQEKKEAFRHYVQTGDKTLAYGYLSGRAIKAARRQRRANILERTRQSESFSTICQCPKCLTIDLHSIQSVRFNRCIRQCESCYYQWRQK